MDKDHIISTVIVETEDIFFLYVDVLKLDGFLEVIPILNLPMQTKVIQLGENPNLSSGLITEINSSHTEEI